MISTNRSEATLRATSRAMTVDNTVVSIYVCVYLVNWDFDDREMICSEVVSMPS